MTKTHHRHGTQINVKWNIDKPYLTRPVITGNKIIDGVLHYTGLEGKLYIAELFDKMFTSVKMRVKPERKVKSGMVNHRGVILNQF